MQEQIQETIFVADSSTLHSMPYLSGLFDAIDDLIINCAKENNVANIAQLKRFVAGHVAQDDWREFEGQFEVLEKKERPLTDWNALMSMTLKDKELDGINNEDNATVRQLSQGKRPRISNEDNATVRQLSKVLKGNNSEAKKLREEVENKKKEYQEKKREEEKKNILAAEKKNTSYRVNEYNKDVEKLKRNLRYMRVNYGSHIIYASINEDKKKQLTYPAYTRGNSGINKHF